MRSFCLLLLVSVVVAACGGAPATTTRPTTAAPPVTTPGTGGGTATNPPAGGVAGGLCDVLPSADVSRISGKAAVVAPDQTNENGCTYNVGEAGSIIPDYVVDFRLDQPGGDLSGPKLAFSGGQDVPGIGEAAYWAPGVTVLWFIRGGNVYAIQFILFGEDDGDALAIAQQLAQVALARL